MSSSIRLSSTLFGSLWTSARALPVNAQLPQHKDLSAATALTIAEPTSATRKAGGYAISPTVVGRASRVAIECGCSSAVIEESMRSHVGGMILAV